MKYPLSERVVLILIMILVDQAFGLLKAASQSQIVEARKLKEQLELEHANDPKDAKSLAMDVLAKAFSRSTNNANFMSVTEIMQKISTVSGEARFYMVRIFELMDINNDGTITNEEYVGMYAEPTASVAKSLEMMHRLCDYNGDGFISTWEQFMALMVGDSNSSSLVDLWKIAVHKHSEMDSDKNGLVSREEFMAFLVYQVQYSIYEQNKYDILQGNE